MKTLAAKGYGSTEPTEQCRTCKGTGKITRKDKEGIAVISYGDERLAPSRTAIYIILAVIVFLVLTGTLVVLFYPRTVAANSSRVTIIYANITRNKTTLVLQDSVHIRNDNYFVSHLEAIDIGVQFQLKEVGQNSTNYTSGSPISIPARSDVNLNYTVNTTLTPDTGSEDVWIYCCFIKYTVGFYVQVNTQFTYFSNTFEFSDNMYQIADCSKVISAKDHNNETVCHLDLTGT